MLRWRAPYRSCGACTGPAPPGEEVFRRPDPNDAIGSAVTKAALCIGLRCCGHYYGNETKGCYGQRDPSRMANCNGITR
jgi:hypothetical protein